MSHTGIIKNVTQETLRMSSGDDDKRSSIFDGILLFVGTMDLVFTFTLNLFVILDFYWSRPFTIHSKHILHSASCELLMCVFVVLPHFANICLGGSGGWAFSQLSCQLSSLAFYALNILSVGLFVQLIVDYLQMVTKGGKGKVRAREESKHRNLILWASICLMCAVTVPLSGMVLHGDYSTPAVIEDGRCSVLLDVTRIDVKVFTYLMVIVPTIFVASTNMYLYFGIRVISRNTKSLHLRGTQSRSRSLQPDSQQALVDDPSPNRRSSLANRPIWQRTWHIYPSLTGLTIFFLVTWLPFFCLTLVYSDQDPRKRLNQTTTGTFWFLLFKSAICPFLFAVMSPKFRQRLRILCRCKVEKKDNAGTRTNFKFSRNETAMVSNIRTAIDEEEFYAYTATTSTQPTTALAPNVLSLQSVTSTSQAFTGLTPASSQRPEEISMMSMSRGTFA